MNYYSSNDPAVLTNGLRTGTATADNARVLTERRMLYNVIGDESGTCYGNFVEPSIYI